MAPVKADNSAAFILKTTGGKSFRPKNHWHPHSIAKAAALNGYMREEAAQAALREAFVASFETTQGPTSGKLRGQIKH